jgi:hypothetical protein
MEIKQQDNSITAILTVWRRGHLREQLQALLQQTLPPDFIWVQQTQKHVNVECVIDEFRDKIKYSYFSENKGIFGRFESVKEVQTQFVFIIDDDMIPGYGFLENAMRLSLEKNAIVSPAGRIIPHGNLHHGPSMSAEYYQKYFMGDGTAYPYNFCAQDTCVHFGNNAWLFRTKWMKYFFSVDPFTRESGEDIHLSATCKLFGDINTYVPLQNSEKNSVNIKRHYSFDDTALCRQHGFHSLRSDIVLFFKQSGWLLQ